MLKVLPFLTSVRQEGRTWSPDNRDHLHTDILRPVEFHEISALEFELMRLQVACRCDAEPGQK